MKPKKPVQPGNLRQRHVPISDKEPVMKPKKPVQPDEALRRAWLRKLAELWRKRRRRQRTT